jgi:hypothetical protein
VGNEVNVPLHNTSHNKKALSKKIACFISIWALTIQIINNYHLYILTTWRQPLNHFSAWKKNISLYHYKYTSDLIFGFLLTNFSFLLYMLLHVTRARTRTHTTHTHTYTHTHTHTHTSTIYKYITSKVNNFTRSKMNNTKLFT